VAVQFGIVTSVVPPGSWHYPQRLSNGQSIKITGDSFEQLLENMLDFRRRHIELCGAENAYIERVRADLKEYFCAHFRQNCADSRTAPQNVAGIGIASPEYHRPIDRAANWLAAMANQQPEFVDYGLAGHRAEICAQCVFNIRWATPCGPCNENVEVRVQQLKGNLRTPLDRRLFVCRAFGWVNEVSIWLKNTEATPLHPPPPNCWKVNESRTNT
jgi:hypothetical protein